MKKTPRTVLIQGMAVGLLVLLFGAPAYASISPASSNDWFKQEKIQPALDTGHHVSIRVQ